MKIYLPLLDNGNHQVMAAFMCDFFEAFRHRDVHLERASDSHANRGMNKIANDFLRTECDIWFNIDADLRFRPIDVDNLLSHDLPLVYGIYPKKEDAAEPCLGTFDDIEPDYASPLLWVRRCGRGCMVVKREVLEKMKEDNGGPALRYHNHGRVEWDFFPSGPVTGSFSFFGSAKSNPDKIEYPMDEDGYPKREWISEDWMFCERARALGIKTIVDSRVALRHIGIKEYQFNPDQLARTDSNITSWRDIHGWFDYENLYKDLAKALRTNALVNGSSRFVEVGCWLGRSMGAMYDFIFHPQEPTINIPWPITNVELHAVDTFEGLAANKQQRMHLQAHGGNIEKAFRANMAALGVPVIVHAKPSVLAAEDFEDASCDAIFIDGDHQEAAVTSDIEAWLPKVKPGGMLCGHDIDEPGVANAVNAAFGGEGRTQDPMGRIGGVFVGSKMRPQVFGRCWFVKIPDTVDYPIPAGVRYHVGEINPKTDSTAP